MPPNETHEEKLERRAELVAELAATSDAKGKDKIRKQITVIDISLSPQGTRRARRAEAERLRYHRRLEQAQQQRMNANNNNNINNNNNNNNQEGAEDNNNQEGAEDNNNNNNNNQEGAEGVLVVSHMDAAFE